MRIDRPALAVDSSSGLLQGWNRFWFAPMEASQLHRLRVLSGLLFLFWLAVFAGNQGPLLSLQGWFDRTAYLEVSRQEQLRLPAPIGWSIFYLADGNGTLFQGLYWGSLAVVALFTLGVAPRITGILTWIVVVSATANPATTYDADFLLVILAFYLMIGYALLGLRQSDATVLERVLGPRDAFLFSGLKAKHVATPRRSYAANLAIRLLQVHFAVVVAANGLYKLQNPEYWGGVAFWFPLHPPFQTTRLSYDAERATAAFTLTIVSILQYLVLAWQIGFPAFAWRRGFWRVLLIGGALAGWIGTVFLLGLPLFGPIYLIGCLSYVHADEWQRVRARFRRGAEKPDRAATGMSKMKVESR